MPLTVVEATAVVKLAEKELKIAKEEEGNLKPGNYAFDFSLKVNGSMGRGADTKVTPSFKLDSLLKALLLRYAEGMEDPQQWLEEVMSIDGALGAIVQLGADAVLKNVPPELLATWDAAGIAAKNKHKSVAVKNNRAGNTSIVGSLEKIPNYEGDLARR